MRYNNSHRSATIVLLLVVAATSLSQSVADVRELELGKPIERELGGGGMHVFSVKLQPGQFLKAVVDQRGIDVVITLLAPDGTQLKQVDSPNGAKGPEPVSFLAKSSGAHQIKVHSLEKGAATGRYEVQVEALRDATPEDKRADRIETLAATLAVVKTEDEGVALLTREPELVTAELSKELNDLGRPQKAGRALITFRLALRVAEQAGYRKGIARSLNNIGTAYHNQRNLKEAFEYYQKSLPLTEQGDDKVLLAALFVNIGVIYQAQGKPALAMENFQKVLKLGEASSGTGLVTAGFNIGNIYLNQGKYAEALENFNAVLKLIEARGDSAWTARLLNSIGRVGFLQGNYPQALEHYRKSLSLREGLGNKLDIAETLNNMGLVYRLQGDLAAALDHAQRALALSEPLENKRLTADILMSIGLVYGTQGDLARALEAYQRSLSVSEESENKGVIANALEKIGGIYHSQGKIDQALEHFQKSLKLVEETGNKRQIIFTMNAIAGVHNSQGNYGRALDYFQSSLKLSEEIGNKSQIATALSSIGGLYSNQGEYTRALDYYERAWKLREEIGEARGVVASINNVGTIYGLQGDYAQALFYFQKTLTLSEKLGNKGVVRTALNNIGEMYLELGDYAKALEASRKSLGISEEMGNTLFFPETMNILARIHLSQGDYAKALDLAERAATIASQTGHRAHFWRARTTAGRAYRALDQSDKALQAFEEAISTIESLRTGVAGQAPRASYFATVQKPYELSIDLLMQLHKLHPSEGYDASALQIGERARARSLLDALSEARADIREGVDPELLQRERTLQQQLNAAGERQTRLLIDKHTEEQVAKVKKEIDALTSEFQDVEGQIRQRSPRYAALTQPAPLDLKEIQAKVLDADTLLLEYALGEEKSYLWAVTPTSINSFELPKRSEIEADVRRAVGLLSGGKQWTTSAKVQLEYAEVAGRLSQMLLAPVAGQLKGKRLLIVGDGALQYLPFGALPSLESVAGMSGRSSRRARINRVSTFRVRLPLTVEHEIVSLPSASTLAILRRETANRKQSAKSVAVLADPVFERDDERLRPVGTMTVGGELPNPPVEGSAQVVNSRFLLERAFGLGLLPAANGAEVREILRIPRLPFTRREAAAILAAAPTGEGMQALDFQASRAMAMNPDLSEYRIVHFATHGLLNSEHPELSGIVLSLLNEAGEPVNGFLRLHEIYNLNLPAELVVLSACQTGLGKEVRGEGLVGLTRGFMYAGAPRVVASLWKVDDAATAELMKRFYSAMLKDNLRPAAALRRAKVEMWKQKRWQAPFYWAAFELQGEWK